MSCTHNQKYDTNKEYWINFIRKFIFNQMPYGNVTLYSTYITKEKKPKIQQKKNKNKHTAAYFIAEAVFRLSAFVFTLPFPYIHPQKTNNGKSNRR